MFWGREAGNDSGIAASRMVQEEGAVPINTTFPETRTRWMACCGVSGTRSRISMRRAPVPRLPISGSAASPRFFARNSSPPRSANTTNTIAICSVSSIRAHTRVCLLQHVPHPDGERISNHHHFHRGQLRSAGPQGERSTVGVIGFEDHALAEIENFSYRQRWVSELHFDGERKFREALQHIRVVHRYCFRLSRS